MYYAYSPHGYYVTPNFRYAQNYCEMNDGFLIRYSTLDLYPKYSTEWEKTPEENSVILITL